MLYWCSGKEELAQQVRWRRESREVQTSGEKTVVSAAGAQRCHVLPFLFLRLERGRGNVFELLGHNKQERER